MTGAVRPPHPSGRRWKRSDIPDSLVVGLAGDGHDVFWVLAHVLGFPPKVVVAKLDLLDRRNVIGIGGAYSTVWVERGL